METAMQIQSLEPRQLLASFVGSFNVVLVSREVVINCTDRSDVVRISTKASQLEVLYGTPARLTRKMFNNVDFGKVSINGRKGDDSITVNQLPGSNTLLVVDGMDGVDTIQVISNSTNIITGGPGRDTIEFLGGRNNIGLRDGEIDNVNGTRANTYIRNRDNRDRVSLV
jgi:hypothetical protein